MNGAYFGSLSELGQHLEKLSITFQSSNIIYEIEYYSETEEGEMLEEIITLRHPEYWK